MATDQNKRKYAHIFILSKKDVTKLLQVRIEWNDSPTCAGTSPQSP